MNTERCPNKKCGEYNMLRCVLLKDHEGQCAFVVDHDNDYPNNKSRSKKMTTPQGGAMTRDEANVLEPDGGNLYKPHKFQISSGQFWRCTHGLTGFGKGMVWIGCEECRASDPRAYEEWNARR